MTKPKILYVEDEPFLGKIVKESLESREFTVHMVDDGDKVMQAAADFKPDLCILDIMLPNRDGYELGEDLRTRYPFLPIIYVTAKVQTEDVLKGFQSGGNDYLRKPFSMEELIVRVHNLLQLAGQPIQAPPQEAHLITLGMFLYDTRKYELRINEKTQKLSYREAELLKILIQHRNFPVERKLILQTIWGDDSFFNSRNLDVYITHLREYFKEDPNIQIITLKGVGYQFVY